MTELLLPTLTAFTIGLLGSGHCLAMCGGIMGALSMRSVGGQTAAVSLSRTALLQQLLLYSSGRLLSYTLLGLAMGLIAAVFVAVMEPLQGLLRAVAGGLLIAMGLYLAGIWQGMMAFERLGHGIWQRLSSWLGSGRLAEREGSLLLGMSWGLLPCGLVYGTLVWAGSHAHPVQSAWLMFAFGLGTLPTVVAGGYFGSSLMAALRRRGTRQLAGLLIVAFGLWTLFAGGDWVGHGHGHNVSAAGFPAAIVTVGRA